MVRTNLFFKVKTQRRLRSGLLLGHVLTMLAAYMALAQQRPYLWLMDDWGEIHVPPFVWPVILGGAGIVLSRTRRPGLGMLAAMAAFVLFVTMAAAAYLTTGANAVTAICSVLAFHSAWTATDFKTITKERVSEAGTAAKGGT